MTRRLSTFLFLLIIMGPVAACSDGGIGSGLSTDGSGEMYPDAAADALPADDDAGGEDAGLLPACVDGLVVCISGKKATCDIKFGWLLESCPTGETCVDGECIAQLCKPLEARCQGDAVQICAPDGKGWSETMPCPQDKVCIEGTCVAPDCAPGEKFCLDNKVMECAEDILGWTATPCGESEICFEGICIECIKDSDCEQGLLCEEGFCVEPVLEIITEALPDGKESEAYEATLTGQGGVEPYLWETVEGALPAGLEMSDDGVVSGPPEESGDFQVTVELSDDLGEAVEKTFDFTIYANAVELVITTGSPLPKGEEGTPYHVELAATGGEPPYIWGIAEGAIPAGLTFASNGVIDGTPVDHGTFVFKVKVFDNSEDVNLGSKEFTLQITIAPLEIVGSQVYDLWITKVIVLPLITTVDLIPIPYSTDLEAKGGVKPYHWSEQPLPSFVDYLISNSGIPDGLVLEENGQLHGSTTDTDMVVKVSIPFTGIDLSGYFFTAKVEDSQEPPDSASAIYLIPTVPVAW